MGYYLDNTVEVEINGQKVRVFKGEAEKLKAVVVKKVKEQDKK